jgi:mannosyl-3-phosphoglycerate phosphatase family protein
MPTIIIFTDLDGTLLHPGTYSFDEARSALELIRQRDIPLILSSSKTRAEIEVYRRRLANDHPFIFENGGGVLIPEGYFPSCAEAEMLNGYHMIRFGSPYQELRNTLVDLRERLSIRVRGFGDMSAREISALSGLSESEAALAKMREFDEPFIFEGSGAQAEVFLKAIEARGYRWTRGRFYHIIGENDKGRAVLFLNELYEKKYGLIRTIGIGDSLNDLPLLRAVDLPVLVRKADGTYEEGISLPGLIKTDGIGPAGWNRAVMELLSE